MKILHLCSDYDKFHAGLSDSLIDRKLLSTILAYKLRNGAFKEISAKSPIVKINSDVRLLRTPLFHIFRINSAFKKIAKDVDLNFDIVHAHMLFSDGMIAHKIKDKFNIKFIVAVRNSDINYSSSWSIPWLKMKAIKVLHDAERIVFLSPAYIQYLISRIGKKYKSMIESKCIVVPNGIESFWHDNILVGGKKSPSITGEVVVACVGDICSNKNQLKLAEFIQKINSAGDLRLSLMVAGPVIDREIFSRLIQYDFVKYLGVLDKRQLVMLYSKAHIFALISARETFGLVYPEAMSQGLPIVYTKGQGIDGHFPSGDIGYPVSPLSFNDFSTSILKILNNYECISERCIHKSFAFTWSEISRTYERIYHDAIYN